MAWSKEDTIGSVVLVTLLSGLVGGGVLFCTAMGRQSDNGQTNRALEYSMDDYLKYGEENSDTYTDAWGGEILLEDRGNSKVLRLSVRSAGRDREYFTEDDFTATRKELK